MSGTESATQTGGRSWGASRPGSVLGAAALGSAVVAAALAGSGSTLALAATGVGVVGLTTGLSMSDRRVAGLGTVALLGGVLAAGSAGVGPGRLLPATATALLSGEFALGSFDLRAELPGGTTERRERRHVLVAGSAGALVSGATYALWTGLRVGVSVPGVTLLLVAAVALGSALRD